MSPEVNHKTFHINRVKPIVSFDICKDEELDIAFKGKICNQY